MTAPTLFLSSATNAIVIICLSATSALGNAVLFVASRARRFLDRYLDELSLHFARTPRPLFSWAEHVVRRMTAPVLASSPEFVGGGLALHRWR